MPTLVERVTRTIRRLDLLPRGSRAAVAVSGGADSVALLYLLLEASDPAGFAVAGMIHVNHRLRGEASEADEQFCTDLASRLRLPLHVEAADVRAAARTDRRSLEDAARRARYAVLERGRDALRADRVAVGHTRDDQAETVLLKLVRGAGPRGLAGIYPQLGTIVRPLLEVGRAELRPWLAGRRIEHVEDLSNADVSNPRNRMRHEVLPWLSRRFGEAVAGAIARAAEVARADEALLAGLTDEALARVVREATGGGVLLDLLAFEREPLALQRRVVLEALRGVGLGEAGFDAVESVRLLAAGSGAAVELAGGVRADRIGSTVVLSGRASRSAPRETAPFRYQLPVPGGIWVPEAATGIRAEWESCGQEGRAWPRDGTAVLVEPSRVEGGLFVRNWQPGDALRPVGLGGRKKVQDLFVDRKVPRAVRHRLPLVVDRTDCVVWVPGHALDETCRVTTPDGPMVVLRLTLEWGGPE